MTGKLAPDRAFGVTKSYATLAVSHSLGQTRRLADHVAFLRSGKIARTFQGEDLADAALFQQLVEEVF